MTQEDWIKIVPSMIGAVMGFLGITLSKKGNNINIKQAIGGILLSGFTSGCCCILLMNLGVNYELSSVLGSIIGSSGIRGYEYLIEKALLIFDKEKLK